MDAIFSTTIKTIDEQIKKHSVHSKITATITISSTIVIILFLFFNISKNNSNFEKTTIINVQANNKLLTLSTINNAIREKDISNAVESSIVKFIDHQNSYLYISISLYILIFSVTLSLYKFHLNQINKLENKKLAFDRIRIASKLSTEERTCSDLKNALLYNVFENSKETTNINSPIPGHYISDVSANLINKIIDKIDISIKK